MYLTLSICVLFISLVQSVNKPQLLVILYISTLFGLATVSVFETVIVPLASIYASL